MATAAEIADEAAGGDEYLKPADYVGETFKLLSFSIQATQHGDRYVSSVILNGGTKPAHMWTTGAVLGRQLDAFESHGLFPLTVKLTRDGEGDKVPYRFRVVEDDVQGEDGFESARVKKVKP